MPAVIGALVIIGILVTAGFYMARQELRIGVASNHANMAVNIAQAGANEVMANWNGYQLGNIGAWDDTTLVDTIANGIWSVRIQNANNFVYFLTASGQVTEGGALWAGASRTIGIAAKILFANIDPPAALVTRGQVKVGGSAQIVGANTTPPTWGPYCTGLATNDTTGVLVDDASGGNPTIVGAGASITGNPPSDEDANIVDSTFTNFGELDWNELTTIAQIEGKDISGYATINNTLPQVDATTGRCNVNLLLNWGDTVPTNPCGAYFPLIYHGGNLTIQSSGFGQGVLLVEGNLNIRGGYTFFGIIITQGTFSTGLGTNRVVGSVMASNAADLNESVGGDSEIIYSRCSITRSILNNASLSRARPLDERSWVDLTAAVN
jgi:hypothetical protein